MTDHDHGPPQAHQADDLRALGRRIDAFLNPLKAMTGHQTTGFCLLMFDFGKTGRMNYLSNADRGDMLKALKELIANIEAHTTQEPQS